MTLIYFNICLESIREDKFVSECLFKDLGLNN